MPFATMKSWVSPPSMMIAGGATLEDVRVIPTVVLALNPRKSVTVRVICEMRT
jgi:hypothetical protein